MCLLLFSCKLNQEHVSERMYPAVVPKLNGTPLLMTKLKVSFFFTEKFVHLLEAVGVYWGMCLEEYTYSIARDCISYQRSFQKCFKFSSCQNKNWRKASV